MIAISFTWFVRRFYFSRRNQNRVHLIAIDTLIVTASSFSIFWVMPEMFALFKDFGADLPLITRLAIITYPYIILPPLVALVILFLSLRTQQPQTQAVYLLQLSHSLLALASGTIAFYLGAVYALIIFMCCLV